jgi:hypothetical protein
MVTFKPDLKQIMETSVSGDIARREMRMIVQDRFDRGVPMVQAAGCFRLQQKIIMDEFHSSSETAVSKVAANQNARLLSHNDSSSEHP